MHALLNRDTGTLPYLTENITSKRSTEHYSRNFVLQYYNCLSYRNIWTVRSLSVEWLIHSCLYLEHIWQKHTLTFTFQVTDLLRCKVQWTGCVVKSWEYKGIKEKTHKRFFAPGQKTFPFWSKLRNDRTKWQMFLKCHRRSRVNY